MIIFVRISYDNFSDFNRYHVVFFTSKMRQSLIKKAVIKKYEEIYHVRIFTNDFRERKLEL